MDRYLLIERDGGITVQVDKGITTPEELLVLPFVQESLFSLHQKGVKVLVLSEQSAISPSLVDAETLDRIHDRMKEIAEEIGGKITDIFVAPNSELKSAQKAFPMLGLIQLAARKYGFTLNETFFVASSYVSLQAAWAAGLKTAFVKTGKPFQTMQILRTSKVQPDFIVKDLLTASVKIFPD